MKRFFHKLRILFNLLGGYTGSHLKWLAAGMPVRGRDQIIGAMAACSECPHRQIYQDGGELPRIMDTTEFDLCGLCHCFLHDKARMATETCPDTPDRWKEMVDSEHEDSR